MKSYLPPSRAASRTWETGQSATRPLALSEILQTYRKTPSPSSRLPLQRATYDEAKAEVGADKEADLREWLQLRTGKTEPGDWTAFLAGLNKDQIEGLLTDYRSNKGLVAVAPAYKNYDEIKVLTIDQLDTYANQQIDWHAAPGLDATQRRSVWEVLSFMRTGNHQAACGGMTTEKVIAEMAGAQFWVYLDVYSKARADAEPVSILEEDDAEKAAGKGKSMQTLQDGMGAVVLKGAMTKDAFEVIHSKDLAASLAEYYTTTDPTPLFQSRNDFIGYCLLVDGDGATPATYTGGVIAGKIRSYHRFKKNTLDHLQTNYGNTSKTKPLTLILHTALDHNGAFVRDDKLDALVADGRFLVLLIEGKESLDQIKAEIGPLATQYGKNDKIDQVMIAGHGGAQSVQLAGKLKNGGELDETGKLKEDSDALNIVYNQAKAQELIDTLLNHMEKKRRGVTATEIHPILLNACLTNSNQVEDVSNDLLFPKKHIRDQIKEHPNLVRFVDDRIKEKKSLATAKGANASIKKVDLFDAATGKLDLVSTVDPKVTASKEEYAREGTEPTGVMRAVVECWGFVTGWKDRPKLKADLNARSKKGSKTWDICVIESLLGLVTEKLWENAYGISMMPNFATVLSAWNKDNGFPFPANVKRLIACDGIGIFDTCFRKLKGTDEWGANHFIPLIIYQVWICTNPGEETYKGLLKQLSDHFNCDTARPYLRTEFIKEKMAAILNMGGGDDNGKRILALCALLEGVDEGAGKTYLTAQLGAAEHFDPSWNIATLLGGRETEGGIVRRLRGGEDLMAVPLLALSVPAARSGNVKLEGDTENRYYIPSVTKKGKIKGGEADVFKKPDETADKAGKLAVDKEVIAVGANYEWVAIEHTYGADTGTPTSGTAFVSREQVEFV